LGKRGRVKGRGKEGGLRVGEKRRLRVGGNGEV